MRLFALAAPAAARPAPARPVDWVALQAEAVQTLSDYICVNTANAPGNERAGAEIIPISSKIEKNGVAWSGGPSVSLPVGQTAARVTFGKGQHDFAATDAIGLKVTAGAGFGSQTVDVDGVVFIEV